MASKHQAPSLPRTERLLRALEELFFREGFLRFSTAALAARLRCSKRALYQIAPSRERLFETIIERWLTRIRTDGDDAAARASDDFSAVTEYLNVAVAATRRASASYIRDIADFPAGHRRLMRHQKLRIAGLERLIEKGVASGTFRGVHPKLVAEVLLVSVARLVDPRFLAAAGLSVSKAFEELYNIVDYGLAPKNGRRAMLRPAGPRRRRR